MTEENSKPIPDPLKDETFQGLLTPNETIKKIEEETGQPVSSSLKGKIIREYLTRKHGGIDITKEKLGKTSIMLT